MNWIYIQSEGQRPGETNLWTVGFYSPDGKFEPESDHDNVKDASERVHYLNGGSKANNN